MQASLEGPGHEVAIRVQPCVLQRACDPTSHFLDETKVVQVDERVLSNKDPGLGAGDPQAKDHGCPLDRVNRERAVVRRRIGGRANSFPDPSWLVAINGGVDEYPRITP